MVGDEGEEKWEKEKKLFVFSLNKLNENEKTKTETKSNKMHRKRDQICGYAKGVG